MRPNGKKELKICSYSVDRIYKTDVEGPWLATNSSDPQFGEYLSVKEFLPVPCCQCIGCRLDYARSWSNRLMLELEDHENAWFITLTYNEQNVPRSYYGHPETGEAIPSLTLCKKDIQDYHKRLRFACKSEKLRFYTAGEYGPKTFRPHYHEIVYGLRLDDLQLLYQKDGMNFYRSPLVERAWSIRQFDDDGFEYVQPIGHVVITPVTFSTCAYVSRYVTKKLTGPASKMYDTFNIVPPFSLMSRNPGIARKYYDEHKDEIYKYDEIYIRTAEKGLKAKPPGYFDALYDLEEPELMGKLKETRKLMAEAKLALKLQETQLSYLELLQVEENTTKERLKRYQRKDV